MTPDSQPPPLERRLRRDAARILEETLAELDPAARTAQVLADHLDVLDWSAAIAERPHPGRTVLLAIGKAAISMTRGALALLGTAVDDGVVLVPHGTPGGGALPASLRLRTAGHPLPDAAGVAATEEIEALVRELGPDDRLLVLLSGGGSALFVSPRPGLGLGEIVETTRLLLGSGLAIEEMNVVRASLERLKGGGLARLHGGAEVLALLLSDIPGGELDAVASGPLSPPLGRPREAETVLRRTGLWEALPEAVRHSLELRRRAPLPEPPAGPAPRLVSIGTGVDAAVAARSAARRAGYSTSVVTSTLSGEARRAGRGLARAGLAVRDRVAPMPLPACLIATGETVVDLRGDGVGGRNQEVALGAAQLLRGRSGVVLASIGTDGIDGPTDAAGAFADGETCARAEAQGLDVDEALAKNDAYPLLRALGDLIVTGPTGTNVADLLLVLVDEEAEAPGSQRS